MIIDKKKLVKDKFYYINYTGNAYQWIFKFSHLDGVSIVGCDCRCIDIKSCSSYTNFRLSSGIIELRDATEFEIAWLNQCIKFGGFVRKEDVRLLHYEIY